MSNADVLAATNVSPAIAATSGGPRTLALVRPGLAPYVPLRQADGEPSSRGNQEEEKRPPMLKRRSRADRPLRNVRFTDKGYSVDPREILESRSAQEILRKVRDNFPVERTNRPERNR